MKLIFLNIDDDLNTLRYLFKRGDALIRKGLDKTYPLSYDFDPRALFFLQRIIEYTDSYIVICSSWRPFESNFEKWMQNKNPIMSKNGIHMEWEAIIKNLKSINADNRIIGVTPHLYEGNSELSRIKEIKAYIISCSNYIIDSYVILDSNVKLKDIVDEGLNKEAFVTLDSYNGITYKTMKEAVKTLNYH